MSSVADVRSMLAQLARRHGWSVEDDHVVVPTRHGERQQRVRFGREGEHVVLDTVVLGADEVTASDRHWRELAIHAWKRNAASNLVTFAFDDGDRLIARVRHLARHLDAAELELYVQVLAAESDRFEYLLTGRDRY